MLCPPVSHLRLLLSFTDQMLLCMAPAQCCPHVSRQSPTEYWHHACIQPTECLVKKMAFACATVILFSLVIWFSGMSQSWMVLFGSLLDQFVREIVLMGFRYSNLMEFDSLSFQQKILMDRFNGLGAVVLSLISASENPRSRFVFELMLLLWRFWVLKRVARSQLLGLFNGVSTILLFLRFFFWRSGLLEYWIRSYVRGHWFGCSLRPGIPLPGCWLHLSFRSHWPYRFVSDGGNCSELAPGLMFTHFLPIPDAESLPFYPLVIKLVVCVGDSMLTPRLHSTNRSMNFCPRRPRVPQESERQLRKPFVLIRF